MRGEPERERGVERGGVRHEGRVNQQVRGTRAAGGRRKERADGKNVETRGESETQRDTADRDKKKRARKKKMREPSGMRGEMN